MFKQIVEDIINLTNEQLNNTRYELCEDNYVGTFKVENRKVVCKNIWFNKNQRCKNKSKIKIDENKCRTLKNNESDKIIVIVLESPHKDEFTKLEDCVAPALGSTGTNLGKCFTSLQIENFRDEVCSDGVYHIILSNAIQYQCSLGEDTEKFRDRIWLRMWMGEGFNKSFAERIKRYNPDIVINLCTKGSHKKDKLAPPRSKTLINEIYLKSISNNTGYLKNIEGIKKTTLQELVQIEIKSCLIDRLDILYFRGNHPSSWSISGSNRRITKNNTSN